MAENEQQFLPDLTRRHFFGTAGATALVAVDLAVSLREAVPTLTPAGEHFPYGVASGDPHHDSVVLWTRVTPDPALYPGVDEGPDVSVTWQVARDPRFRRVVAEGRMTTGPARDYTVKVAPRHLEPETTYFYRFAHAGHVSRTGRTRTTAAPGTTPSQLRLGAVSCSNLQAGYFSAYRHLADRGDLDAVVHLGDYLYEYEPGGYGYGPDDTDIRSHEPPYEVVALADYRVRHAQYKRDPDLQRLHAAVPFITTWDDHEVCNNASRSGADNHDFWEGRYSLRALRARKAYDEWMPVRVGEALALDDGQRVYRGLDFGDLARLSMLDLRSYRDHRTASDDLDAMQEVGRTLTGPDQMTWLKQRLDSNEATWHLVGNPTMIAPLRMPVLDPEVGAALADYIDLDAVTAGDDRIYNTDQWDGYTADRRELFDHLHRRGITGTVFLTGDIHSAWACDLPLHAPSAPEGAATPGPSVATEFVCTSVTSNNLDDILGVEPRTTSVAAERALISANPHVKAIDFDSHGYCVVDVTPERLQVDWYATSDRADPHASASHLMSWATDAGTARVRPASAPVVPGA